MNLRDLRYLVALADHQHFGKAAAASFVSQPTLSTQIKKLEDELGVTLVERAPGNVMLTPIGKDVVSRARTVLTEVDGMVALAKRSRDPESGKIHLGVFPTLGPYLLPHVIPVLHERFPRIDWYLVEEKTDALLQKLREGKLDAALLALPIEGDQWDIDPLFREEFVLAVPKDKPLNLKHPLGLEDLNDRTLLLLDEGHCLRDQALAVCRLSGAREQQDFRATSLETLRQMVGTGLGDTLLPALATLPPHNTDDLQLVPFEGEPPFREISLVRRHSSAMASTLEAIAATIRDIPVLKSLRAPQ